MHVTLTLMLDTSRCGSSLNGSCSVHYFVQHTCIGIAHLCVSV